MAEMTRKRKWMVGVLVVGVGALVLDRTLLGPPEEASASEAALEDDAGLSDETVADTQGPGSPTAVSEAAAPVDLSDFARRLAALPPAVGGEPGREDAFALPADWAATPLDAPSAVEQEPEERSADAQAFLATHKLNATMITDAVLNPDGTVHTPSRRVAVINGEPYHVGAVLDGFRLVALANRMALWQSTSPDSQEQFIHHEHGSR